MARELYFLRCWKCNKNFHMWLTDGQYSNMQAGFRQYSCDECDDDREIIDCPGQV